jgi:putative transposase
LSEQYKVGEDCIPHFVTFAVVGWVDIFSRESYKDTLLKSLEYCINHKGLKVHAWIIMTNHVHLIISSESNSIAAIIRDFKKYTSRQIIKQVQKDEKESRKEWMLNIFSFIGKNNRHNKDFQFWNQNYHPLELSSNLMLEQRLTYLHENPVRSGIVWEPWHYKFSSAIDYYTNERGLIAIDRI